MFALGLLDVLNSREDALLFWVVVGAALAFYKMPALRLSVVQVVHASLVPKLLTLWITVAIYTAAIVFVLEQIGWWHAPAAKETAYWYFGTGLVLAGRATQTRGDPAEFRSLLRRALKLTILLEFFINFWVFPLAVELVFIPFMALLVTMNVVAEREPRFAAVNRLVERLLLLTGGVVAFFVAVSAFASVEVVFSRETLEQLLVAPALTVATIPLLYVVALLTTYELAFMHTGLSLEDPRLARKVKWEIARTCRVNLRRIGRFDGQFFVKVRTVGDEADVTNLVREFESGQRDEAA